MSRTESVALRATGITHQMNGKKRLSDFSLDVPKGAIFGLVGPRGAGKSTALRILATLLEPSCGELQIEGHDALANPELVRPRIGYAAAAWRTHSRLTAREYLEVFASLYAVPESPQAAADTILALTHLGSLADTQLRSLGPDQLQQLQHARTLVHDPDLLLFDDPAQHLNHSQRKEFRDLLLDLQALGKTIVLSSTARNEFTDVCGSLVVLQAGRTLTSIPLVQQELFGTSDAAAPGTSADAGRTPGGVPVPRTALRWLKLETLKHEPTLYEQLMASPAIQHIEIRGTTARVGYVGEDAWIAQLVSSLALGGIALIAVQPERTPLEDTLQELAAGTANA